MRLILLPQFSRIIIAAMFNSRFSLFGFILLIYLVAASLYAILTPPWQAPDEPAHYNYIQYLASEQHFPELTADCYDQEYLNELTSRRFPAELSVDTICYEFHQPPLYYLLATPVYWLSRGSLLALRFLSITFGAGVVAAAFYIGRTIFPAQLTIVYGTMAFIAFVPMHVAILSSVNNDALAELIVALILLLLIHRLNPMTKSLLRNDLLLGAILGLGLLTKTTVYIAIPLTALALWLTELNYQQAGWLKVRWLTLLKQGGIIYGLALLIALPWFIRNLTLYGGFDILGLARHDEIVVGQLRTADLLADVGPFAYLHRFVTTTFHSFWGQFGWMAAPMDGRTYLLLTILTMIALGGLVAWSVTLTTTTSPQPEKVSLSEGRSNKPAQQSYHQAAAESGGSQAVWIISHLTPAQQKSLLLMALAILLVTMGYGWYNLTFVQFQGRYLFAGLIPLGLFFSLGLNEALNRRWAWWLAGGLALCLIWIVIFSGQSGNPDKWSLLITGLVLSSVIGCWWVARYWPAVTVWLLVACYTALGFLTLASPFWYVLPYL